MTAGSLARLGFDPARIGFALRTAVAACLGLLLAWGLGLEHPQWAAMTVWASSQPLRGMLLERSLFRAAGTVIGVAAGVLLVLAAGEQPTLLVLGLAAWLGLCVWLGNLLRGFVSYGTLLAGYSAAMVALLETAHPGHVLALGLDRLLTVLVGVAVAALVGLLLAPQEAEAEVVATARRLTARMLRAMAGRLRAEEGGGAEEQRAILSGLAVLDEALDQHGAGSLRARRAARRLRAVVAAHVPALLWLRQPGAVPGGEAAAAALLRAAEALEAAQPAAALAALAEAEARSARDPALQEALTGLHAALRDRLRGDESAPEPHPPLLLHRDWVGAWQAALRAAGTLLLVGLAWRVTGWSGGPYVLLGTSVMISVFSPMDSPALVLRAVLLGQVFGAAAALACRWLAWPLADGELQLVLLTMPFILLGAPPMAHRRTMVGAFDYNMILLLLLQPAYPPAGSFGGSLATAAAVVAAPAIALVAFSLAFPTDPRRRLDTLIGMMVRELQAMAADRDAPARGPAWRARLSHRLLRLVRWMEKAGERRIPAADAALAVLQLGTAILGMQGLLRGPGLTPGARRGLGATLERLGRLAQAPERAQRALALAARRLRQEAPAEAGLIEAAAEGLTAHAGFFRRGAGAARRSPPPEEGGPYRPPPRGAPGAAAG